MSEIRHLVKKEIDMPAAGKGQVVVKIEYCGICGSDMHFYMNGAIGTRKAPHDFILCHECSGTVVEIGEGVTELKTGDRVALEPGVPCGKCTFCLNGEYNLCPDIHFMAAAVPPTNGALRNYIAYPARWCFRLPENISTIEGVMLEPLAVGMHAARRGEVNLGKTVTIIGVGTIGIMTLMACKAMGASQIIVSDTIPERLKLAIQLGADAAINAATDNSEQLILNETEGLGSDVVFETAGSSFTLASTWKYVKPGGVIVNAGNPSGEIPYHFDELSRKEVDIRHSWRYRHIFPTAIDAVNRGVIPLKNIKTAIFPFEKAREAFEFAINEKSTVLKTIIEFPE